MVSRRRRRLPLSAFQLSLLTLVACGGTSQEEGCIGGCGSSYVFSAAADDTVFTDDVLRLRVTSEGMNTFAAVIPDLILEDCSPTDGNLSENCELHPTNPTHARFYIGGPCDPEIIDVLGSDLEIRSGPCNGVDYHRSSVNLHTDTMRGNIHFSLIDDDNGPGILVKMGCGLENPAECTSANSIHGDLDMVVTLSGEACTMESHSVAEPSVAINSLHLVLRPRIEMNEHGQPVMRMSRDELDMSTVDIDLDFDVNEANGDPECNNGCSCWLLSGLSGLGNVALSFGAVASTLADKLLEMVDDAVRKEVLMAAGSIQMDKLSPSAPTAAPMGPQPVEYRVKTPQDGVSVTGASETHLGFNLDFNGEVATRHATCVPHFDWTIGEVPPIPDFEAEVIEVPTSDGGSQWVHYEFAGIIGDSYFNSVLKRIFDSGSLCMLLPPDVLSQATDGGFNPNIELVSLAVPALASHGGPQTPVALALFPNLPPLLSFGTGEGEGADRESHLHIVWPDMNFDIYPLLDDVYQRVLTFGMDLHIYLSLVPAGNGDIEVMVDRIELENITDTYNEMNIPFDPDGIQDLLSTFLPQVLEPDSIPTIELNESLLDIPLQPKLIRATTLDAAKRYLGLLIGLCSADEIADSTNAICYENAESASERVRSEIQALPGGFYSLVVENDHFEVASRVNGGPWWFSQSEGSSVQLPNPDLAWPGLQRVEYKVRPKGSHQGWSDIQEEWVSVAKRNGPRASFTVVKEPLLELRPKISANPQGGCASVVALPYFILPLFLLRRRRRR